MKIKKDPRAKRTAEIKDVLQRYEWLYFRADDDSPWIDYDRLAELVYDIDVKMTLEDAG